MIFRQTKIVVAAMVLCCACGGEAANGGEASATDEASVEIKRRSGSFLEDYLAARRGAAPAKPVQVSGLWEGVLFCPSGVYPISADLRHSGETVNGSAAIDHAIGDERKPTPFYAEHKGREGEGDYDASIQLFNLRIERNEAAADPRQERGLHLEFMLAPKSGDRALVNAIEISGGRSQRQCAGVAARNKPAEKIRAFKEASEMIRGDRRSVVQGEACPAKYSEWIDAVRAGADPFEDAVFKPAFGSPFRDMDPETLLSASALISGSCSQTDDRAKNIDILRVGAALRNYKEYDAANAAYLRDAVFDDWTAWVDAERQRGVKFDYSTAVALRAAPNRLGLRGDPKAAEFDAEIEPIVTAAENSRYNDDFAERIEAHKDDFETLSALHREARSRGDIDLGMVATGLDYYLADAAQTYAETAEDIRDAVYMNAWTGQYEASKDCPATKPAVCEKAADAFRNKTDKLASQFASAEDKAFKQLARQALGTEGLADLVAFEKRLAEDYAGLLTLAPFEKSADQRAKTRHALQRKHAGEIRKELESVNTAPAIRAIEEKYFAGNDLADAPRQVVAAIETVMAGTRPFSGLSGAEYFNAIYNQDFEALRSLDRRYVAGIRPLMTFGAQQAMELGPLINALSGQRSGTAEADLAHWLQNLSALHAVLGTYLLNYQNVYAKCLQPNAPKMVVTTQTDYVTRDGFGAEISRREGWTTQDSYRVNPEFGDHFTTLFAATDGAAQAQLLDLLVNDAQITFLRQGVERLMDGHDCASPEVKQLEAGFLAYDRELKRRR